MTNFLEPDVYRALQKGVIAAVAASNTPDLPIKALGRTFDINDEDATDEFAYLEIVIIPNNPTDEFWNSGRTYRGLLRLVLHYPNDDQGVYDPLEMLKPICGYFTKDRDLVSGDVTVRIVSPPNFLGDLPSGHETEYPVSMRYTFFQP